MLRPAANHHLTIAVTDVIIHVVKQKQHLIFADMRGGLITLVLHRCIIFSQADVIYMYKAMSVSFNADISYKCHATPIEGIIMSTVTSFNDAFGASRTSTANRELCRDDGGCVCAKHDLVPKINVKVNFST